jgi:pimeloyl-ACP methyl ester carboxylesterase
MELNRRSFLTRVGGVAAVTFLEPGSSEAAPRLAPAAYAQSTSAGGLDTAACRNRANADGEFLLKARYWEARLQLEIGDRPYSLVVQKGRIAEFAPASVPGTPDVRISGPVAAWSGGFVARGLKVEGDRVNQVVPYRGAILRLIALIRQANGAQDQNAATAKDIDRQFDSAVGRYAYVKIQGVQYRVYFEETGQGIPVVLQHTAGSDGRQWRHLLEDEEIQRRFRLIAYDLPYHGKSVPPATIRWWEKEYRLTTELVMESILAITAAARAERPVYMGCSVGGYLAPDLAFYHPNDFRAVIGVNASIAGAGAPSQRPGARDRMQKPISEREIIDTNFHPRVNGESIGMSMYEITSPEAPDAFRRETAWVYGQGGPGVFAGDLYYYSYDHDLVGKAGQIDTARCPVYLISGEYDPSMEPGSRSAEALAKQIPGATFTVIKGGSHFAMSDDYARFRQYLMPILDKIHAQKA